MELDSFMNDTSQVLSLQLFYFMSPTETHMSSLNQGSKIGPKLFFNYTGLFSKLEFLDVTLCE